MTYPLQWIITPRLTQLMKMKRKEAKGGERREKEERKRREKKERKLKIPKKEAKIFGRLKKSRYLCIAFEGKPIR